MTIALETVITTIAFDLHTLAADASIVEDGCKLPYAGKIRRLPSGDLLGFCGDVQDGQTLMARVAGIVKSGKPQKIIGVRREVDVLWIRPDGTAWIVTHRGLLTPHGRKMMAVGKGKAYALGALAMGATAKRAVEIANQYDDSTGSTVTVLTLREKR